MSEIPDHPRVRLAAPVYYAAFLAAAILLQWALPLVAPRAISLRGVAVGAVLLGLLLGFGAVLQMRRHHTTVSPHRPSTALVTDGPYGLSRNPIYLGFMLIYLGLTLLAGTLWGVVLAPALLLAVNRSVILAEEDYLQSKFPDRFGSYRSSVRRWL